MLENGWLGYTPEIPYQLNGTNMGMRENDLAALDTVTWPQWPELRLTVIHVTEA